MKHINNILFIVALLTFTPNILNKKLTPFLSSQGSLETDLVQTRGMVIIKKVNNYVPFIISSKSVTIYCTETVAIAVAQSANINLHHGTAPMETVLGWLKTIVDTYEDVVGYHPRERGLATREFTVEVDFLDDSAGLADHGIFGLAVGPAYLQQAYDSVVNGDKILHQVFFYETFRNFINPQEFTPAFEYACTDNAASWGFVNQGFINIVGAILSNGMGLGFDYYGQDAQDFIKGREDMSDEYIAHKLAWKDGLGKNELIPYDQDRSIDNIWSGFISKLYKMCGGKNFFKKLFRLMPGLALKRGGPSYNKANQGAARDNMFIAVSLATLTNNQADIVQLFKDFHIPYSPNAVTYVDQNK